MKHLECTITYRADNDADRVPWRYEIMDDEGTTLAYGYASTRDRAKARAAEDAKAIRDARDEDRSPETYEL